MARRSLLPGAAPLAWGLFALSAYAAPAPVDFQRQVRPILSDNCFLCHGPDKGTRMVDLRLDIKDGALASRKNGTPVVPGKPDESLIVRRIFSDKASYRMPPAYSHKTLTAEQKEILRRWIAEGAKWTEHWAYAAPVKTPLPQVQHTEWPRNAIDTFLLARMEAAGLSPAPEANRATLIRRVTLDLTGLPPTPTEVKAFVNDRSSGAYDRLVDHLLASPHYGEHRARYWLDAARYADTQGLHIDNYREMWPYRDWVIAAFNKNEPFNRFTVEQVAGDMLPNATLDQKIASGFHRCNVTTNEGGAIADEVAAIYAKDRADTTGAVWLGLTVGCATCHDHKFDPISQKDFYSLTAFFRNTTQYPMDGNVHDTPPVVLVPQGADRPRWEKLAADRAVLVKFISDRESQESADFKQWLESPERANVAVKREAVWEAQMPSDMPAHVSALDDGSHPGLMFAKDGLLEYKDAPAFRSDKPFTVAAWVRTPDSKQSSTVAGQIQVVGSEKMQKRLGWTLDITPGNFSTDRLAPYFRIMGPDERGGPHNEYQFLSAHPDADYEFKPNTWYHIAFSYNGSERRNGLQLFVNGRLIPTYGTGEDSQTLKSSFVVNTPIHLGGGQKAAFRNGAISDFTILQRSIDETDARMLAIAGIVKRAQNKPSDQLTPEESAALKSVWLLAKDGEGRTAVEKLHAIDTERTAIARRSPTTFVMDERADSQPIAHVLYRGMYDQPKDEVHPKVPSCLPQMPASYPQNRLGLARWLVDDTNPIVARVTVNRLWQEIFGIGIVKTAEDFGSQGEPPSHPELLDWLAVDFRENGWDVKRYVRMMVTSAAYRQAAISTPEQIAKDPDNRLLSHGPRFRMDGEMIRDYALFASGMLRDTVGGPSVRPYQPPNIWEAVAMEQSNTRTYQRDHGDALYRRSMYTFWKRSAPPASMDVLNAPSREVCTVRRERTDTPLQALLTMNDPQFVEAARVLAERAIVQGRGNLHSEVDYMSSHLLARSLASNEFDVVERSYRDFMKYYDSKPDDAVKLLAVGDWPRDRKLDQARSAALTMVANEMMNMDEVLVK